MRYSPRASPWWSVTLNADNFIVRMVNGPGVTPEALARIGKRYYSHPDKPLPAAGLGYRLSTKSQVHGMNVEFGNAEQGRELRRR
ncbi:hypothetical protein ACNKHR_17620 [Shigella flexneri]